MLEIKHVSKVFRLSRKQMKHLKTTSRDKYAVRDLSFHVFPGEIYGLLGSNGAGKTTMLRCIATLLKPSAGEIFVNGYDTVANSEAVRREIGFLTSALKLDPHFTPAYTIHYFGHLYGLPDQIIEKRTRQLFKRFDIDSYANVKIGKLSTGMTQKLSLAVSLIHDPQVIIFDEPTNGLDIVTAHTVTDYLQEMRLAGKTIVISTHIMSVAARLCDRIGIILNGEMQIEGTLTEILDKTGTTDIEEAFFQIYRLRCEEEQL